jgi:hypothetical protein
MTEVGKMPANRKANETRRLTVAGLIAVTAATLLMMGWAIFPSTAGAAPDDVCPGAHFELDDLPVTTMGVTITAVDSNTVHVDIPEGSTVQVCLKAGSAQQQEGPEIFTLTADGDITTSSLKEISHFSVISVTVPTTSTATTTTTTTVPTSTTTTTTTTVPTTTTATTTTTVPTTTTATTTTTVPGGGGGGGGTTTVPVTTTTTPTVGPTTVQPSTTTKSPNVAPTTVSPRGTAFTGVENVVPIGAIALMLMTSGTGLLWAGSRRKRDQNQDEE